MGSRIKDQGPGTMVQGQGSRINDQGSNIKDKGPCQGTKEHPRRIVDVILSQIKAPIEILNSR